MISYIVLAIGIVLTIGNYVHIRKINKQIINVDNFIKKKHENFYEETSKFWELEKFYKEHGDKVVTAFSTKEREKRKQLEVLRDALKDLVKWEKLKLEYMISVTEKFNIPNFTYKTDIEILEKSEKILNEIDIHYSLDKDFMEVENEG